MTQDANSIESKSTGDVQRPVKLPNLTVIRRCAEAGRLLENLDTDIANKQRDLGKVQKRRQETAALVIKLQTAIANGDEPEPETPAKPDAAGAQQPGTPIGLAQSIIAAK